MTRHREIVMVDPQTDQGPRISFTHPWMRAWMRFGLFLGNIMGWIILSLFYVLIITPYGLVFRLFRVDPLRMRSKPSTWIPLPSQYDQLEDAKRQ